MKPVKKAKSIKQFHTANTKIGKGDSYGTGIKQKVGKSIVNSMDYHMPKPNSLKKPPKSLA